MVSVREENILFQGLDPESDRAKMQFSKYSQIIDNSPDAIITTDTSGIITMWNKGAERIYEYQKSEAIGQPITIIYKKKDYPYLESLIGRLIQGEDIDNIELTLLRKSNKEVDVLLSLSTIKDSKGKIIEFVGITKDITAIRKVERSLRIERDRSQQYLNIAGVMLIALDSNGQIALINPKGCKILGYKKDELIGKNWFSEFVPKNKVREVREVFKKIISGDVQPVEFFENPIVCKDGSEKLIAWHNSALTDHDGNIIGLFSSGEDITEKRVIARTMQKYFEMSSELICQADINTATFTLVSSGFTKTLGYNEEELLSKSFLGFIHPDDKDNTLQVIEEQLQKGNKVLSFINRYRCRDGSYVVLDWNSHPVPEEGFTYAVARDITAQKKAEEALLENQKRYEKAQAIGNVGNWEYDPKTNKVWGSDEAKRIYGFDLEKEDFSIENVERCILERERVHQALVDLIEEDKKYDIEFCIITHDKGIHKTLHSIAEVERDENGNPIKVAGVIADITNRKENEQIQQEQKAQLQTLLETLPDLVWLKDPNGVYLACNRRFEDFLGTNANDIIGKTDYDFIDKELSDFFRDHDKAAVAAGKPTMNEEEITFKSDGHKEILETIKTPMYDLNGNLLGVLGIGRDITERKNAVEKLRESEKRFRTSFEASAVGMAIVNGSGNFLATNSAACKSLGYTKKEMLQINFADVTHKDDIQRSINRFRKSIEDGKPYTISKKYVTKNDDEIIGLTTVSPIFDANGSFLYAIAHLQDITELKQAEDKLRESQEKFKSYVYNSPYGIFVVNSEGFYIDANPATEKITGYSRDELISMHLLQLIPEGEREAAKERFEELKNAGVLRGRPTQYQTKSGEIRYWIINAIKMTDDSLIGFVNDVTETQRLQKLESRAERLEMAGTIAGQVAHDFNNLLGPLVAYPDFIKDELPEDNKALGYLEDIKNSAIRIADINIDLLTLSRRGHYNLEVLDINAIVQQAINEFNHQDENISFEANLEKRLLPIKGGAAQIYRMFNNILNNAIDAVGGIGEISITTENHYSDNTSLKFGIVPKGEYVRCMISDNGCGISSEVMDKMFDPFFSTKKAGSRRGSGLGLSVVQAVMSDHGGYIDIDSKIGSGTTFYLYFPICRDIDNEKQEEEPIDHDVEAFILVVDDDEIQRRVTLNLLKNLGYNAITVSSGEEAVEYCKNNEPDLIVLDMIMPDGIDGAETFRRIKEINPDQRAILLSGQSESNRVLEAQSLGAGIFVRKPVTKSTLSKVINHELVKTAKN